jgi:hypothetical protein
MSLVARRARDCESPPRCAYRAAHEKVALSVKRPTDPSLARCILSSSEKLARFLHKPKPHIVMHPELQNTSSTGADLQVLLDGLPVILPAQKRSLAAIRSYLELLALEQQRILFSFRVDGARINLSAMLPTQSRFAKVEAETLDLTQVPLQLIKTAMVQTSEAKSQIISAVTLVLINEPGWAREHWWNLVRVLNQPLLTLSLMPENAYSSTTNGTSLTQLRKWQLQQLAAILKDVDLACWSDEPGALSNALEYRVLPWLQGLQTSLELWHETLATKPEGIEAHC